MDTTAAFSSTLARIRRSKQLSQESLAERAGLHPTTISLLELGKREPSFATVVSLAHALGIAPDEFVREVLRGRSKKR